MTKRAVAKKGGADIGNTLYDGAADFGKFMALVSMVIGMIISAILIVIAIYLLLKHDKHSVSVKATVTDAKCTRVTIDKSVRNDCILTINYTAGESKISKEYNTIGKYYTPGDTISIRYDPDNPTDFTTWPRSKTIGWIMLVIGIVLAITSWVYWWVVNRFKFAAAASGVGTAWDIIK